MIHNFSFFIYTHVVVTRIGILYRKQAEYFVA